MTRIVDDDDAEIEAEIQRELDAISAENLEIEDLEEDESSFELTDKDDNPLPESIEEYLRFVQSRTDNIQQEVNECDTVLQNNILDKQKNEDQILAEKIKEALGDDCHDNPLEIRNKVLTEIEEAEEQEEKDKIRRASQDNNMAIDIIRPNISDEIRILEETAAKQLQELEEKQTRKTQERMEMYERMKREENERLEKGQNDRKMRQKELEDAQKRMNENQKVLQEKIEIEKKQEEQELSILEKNFQREIKELEEENKKEKKALQQIQLKEAEYQRNKTNKAAITIQKTYRGYRVYKQHKETLEAKTKERIHKQDKELEKKYTKEIQQKETEEREVKELKEQKRIEEERIRKEEQWKKETEDKKKRDDETKRREEVERRKREEEEKRRKEDEEKKRIDEEKRKEESRKRDLEISQRKKMEEEKKRIEEEQRLQEEKRKEEERKRQEEIEKQKEEERKKREEEERKRREEETIKEELKREEIRREEIRREKEELERKRKEEMKRKEIEEMERTRKEKQKVEEERIKQEELRNKDNKEKQKVTGKKKQNIDDQEEEGTAEFTPAEITNLEVRRQKWLKEHIPWSTSTCEDRTQPVARAKPRQRPRRPFSASKSLPSLTKEQILQASPPGTSLHKVIKVSLRSCPACNMNGLDSCPSLKTLTMKDCGLLAVEGLDDCKELQELTLQDNKIEYINIKDLHQVQDIVLTNNSLTSVQGLTGCTQLRNLDLRNNKITRIGDLSSCPNLQFLIFDNNQLIMTKGLSNLPRLQSLSCTNNHLPNVKEIDSCQLLQKLDLTGNNLQKPPLLTNHVLLQEIQLDNNSISTLEPLADAWLPSLQVLSVSQNSISNIGPLSGLIMLHTLDISHNLISDLDGLLSGLSGCRELSVLKIAGNPVNEEPQCRDTILGEVPHLTQLDDEILQSKASRIARTSSPFISMCFKQLKDYKDMISQHKQQLSLIDENTSDSKEIIKRLKLKSQQFEELHQQAVNHLLQHEKFDVKKQDENYNEPIQEKKEKDEKLSEVEAIPVNTDKKTDFEKVGLCKEPRKAANKITRKEAATKIQALWRGWHIRHLIDLQMKRWLAAVPIQAAWRGYLVRSRAKRKPRVSRARKALWSIRHDAAATTIQACYRGYRVRRILAQALQTTKYDSDEDDFNYDEEVDLTAFDFDNGMLDDGWTPTDTPQLPSRGPALPKTGQALIQSKPKSHQPRQAWRSADSPMDLDQQANQHQVAGLNLQRSPENDLMSVTSGTQSHMTHRAEEMSCEWGLKDASTAELMWKRANRMKYNPARKRKLLDPTKRLALFKKLDEANKLREVKPPPKRQQRVDYFAAREANMLPSGTTTPTTEREVKAQMTYSWVHNQGVVHEDQESNYMGFTQDYSTPTKHKKPTVRSTSLSSKSSVSLPQLDPVQLSGRNIPLVSSPALILEQMSRETTPRRHSSISEDVHFPPIKTYSVPNLVARSSAGTTSRNNQNEKSNSAGARMTNEKRELR